MLRKIVNFFSSIPVGSLGKIFYLAAAILLGVLSPLYFANAALSDLARLIVNGLFSVYFLVITFISALILGVATFVLNWVISDNFISFSYTGLDNPVIAAGWTIIRDLTNIAFVVILLFIGLAIAIRYKEYKAEKLLPRLILIMLIVNFSNVICGVVVDASNILMNFFLQKVTGFNALVNFLQSEVSIIGDTIQKGGFILGIIPTIVVAVILSFFNLFVTILLLMFAGIFALRYIAIWVLVILSPAAFAAWILPDTRKYYQDWINQFTQWCFIGITTAFFLYLGNYILVYSRQIIGAASPMVGLNDIIRTTLESMSGFVVAFFFLWFGLFSAISTSAMGSGIIIDWTRKSVKSIGKTGLQGIKKTAQKPLGRAAETVAAGLDKWEEVAKKYPATTAIGGMWAMRGALKGASSGLKRYAEKAREAEIAGMVGKKFIIPKNFDDLTLDEQTDFVNSLPDSKARAVVYAHMAEKETLKRTDKEFQKKVIKEMQGLANDPRFKKEFNTIFNVMPNMMSKELKMKATKPEDKEKIEGQIEEIAKQALDLIPDEEMVKATIEKFGKEKVEKATPEEREKMKESAARDIGAQILQIKSLNPGDIVKLSKEALGSLAMRVGARSFAPAHIQRLYDSFDRETVEKIFDEPGGIRATVTNEAELLRLYIENPRLVNWMYRNPQGRDFAEGALPEISNYKQFTTEAAEIRNEIKNISGLGDEEFEKLAEKVTSMKQDLNRKGSAATPKEIMILKLFQEGLIKGARAREKKQEESQPKAQGEKPKPHGGVIGTRSGAGAPEGNKKKPRGRGIFSK
jgi:hypothetical protein